MNIPRATNTTRLLPGLLLVALLTLAACANSKEPCVADADCASGLCKPDGTCGTDSEASNDPNNDDGNNAPNNDVNNGVNNDVNNNSPDADSDASDPDADAPNNDTPDADPDADPDTPDDGIITRDEVPIAAGLRATFKIAPNATVDTRGQDLEGNRRQWDFSAELPGDHLALVETRDIDDEWFADLFPTATYASRLSDSANLLGVFQATDDALLLLGVVSPEDGFARTELLYDPPVIVLQFPLELGAEWSTESTVSGTNLGVPGFYFEDYTSRVDAAGRLAIPFGDFEVLRVQTELTRTVGIIPTTIRSFIFVTETFGTIANVVSQDNEANVEFTEASELRRLAP